MGIHFSRVTVVGAVALSLLTGVGAIMSHARQTTDKPTGETFGMVDMDKLYEASDSQQQYAQMAQQIEADGQSRVEAVGSVPMLNDAELKEFGDLVGIKSPDARQKVRMDELKEFSDQRVDRLRKVQMKPDSALTAEDRRFMVSSAQLKKQFDRIMAAMQADIRQQIAEREDAVKRSLFAKLRQEVNKVAKEKKIQHVFDATVMVSSSTDLTPFVLQRVKKAKPGAE